MNRKSLVWFLTGACVAAISMVSGGCGEKSVKADSANAAILPPAQVEPDFDVSNFKVAHPEQFPLASAGEHDAAPELNVTGVVNPDVSRQVPVPSLASGRVVEIDARLGDYVQKGQLLFKLRSTDVAGAYSDYRQAVKNELLTKLQLDRAKILYENGAYPKSQLEIAQNADDDAQVVVETTLEHLRLLGVDPDHPTGIVEIHAPVAGTITDQQITNSAGVQALTPPNPFTISDLSHVWIVCDVYENDMGHVHIGEFADIRVAAYPDRPLKAKIGNILPVMDPSIRTAKVRLEIENPGILRIGMFVTATFHGLQAEKHAIVPASAILHLHDREWVYSPVGDQTGHFRRIAVVSGVMLPNDMQEVISGIPPGTQVVSNALVMQDTVEQ